jgi:hypothetical protein
MRRKMDMRVALAQEIFNFSRVRPTLALRIGAHLMNFINVPWNLKKGNALFLFYH